jgi:very-short-patch-repair endonuclease
MTRNKIIWYNPKLRSRARKLRLRSTRAEKRLWKYIKSRSLGCEFHRQCPIDYYIVDFYCHELMLAIEVDGCSHLLKVKEDRIRQDKLERLGVRFLRFTDEEVLKDIDNVLRRIQDTVDYLLKTSPLPPLKGEAPRRTPPKAEILTKN